MCWLLLRPLDERSAEEQAYHTRLAQTCPQVAVAAALVDAFGTVLRDHDVNGLDTWLGRAETSGISELEALARSIRLDHAAVEAAVRLAWSKWAGRGAGQ